MRTIDERQEPGERAPAPGELRLVQAFVNSCDLEDEIEEFATAGETRAWLVSAGLLEADVTFTEQDRLRLIGLREALRDLLAAHAGHPVARDAPDRFRAATEGARLAVRIAGDGTTSLVPVSEGIDGAVARLVAIIHAADREGTWQRLKTCHNVACRWAFYDASRNRSGSWCAMGICGSRSKARAYRKRHAR